jgi:hypothetical protein
MSVVVKVTSSEGSLLFETDPTEADLAQIGLSDRAKDIVKGTAVTAESVVSTVRLYTHQLMATIDDFASEKQDHGSLASATIELGIKITAEGNIIVAKGTAEANLTIGLTWDFT